MGCKAAAWMSVLAMAACGPQMTASSGGETGTSDGSTGPGDGGTDPGSGGSGDGGSDGSGDGGSSATGTGTGLIPCDPEQAVLEPIPPQIHLVLDKSGSMVAAEGEWDHDGEWNTPYVTRWYSVHEVVELLVTGFELRAHFGLVLFPGKDATGSYGAEACVVADEPDVPLGPANAQAILDAMPPKTATSSEMKGATPATSGLVLAYEDLQAQGGDNAPAVIFVTDGAANCDRDSATAQDFMETYDDDLLPVVSEAWLQHEIPTYVVGINIENAILGAGIDGEPEANPYERLDELAVAGGRPNPAGPPAFYQAENQLVLTESLQQIVVECLSCTVTLDPVPEYPEHIEVFVGGTQVPEISDCASEDGWTYAPPGPPWDTIELCGTACDALRAEGEVVVSYECGPG